MWYANVNKWGGGGGGGDVFFAPNLWQDVKFLVYSSFHIHTNRYIDRSTFRIRIRTYDVSTTVCLHAFSNFVTFAYHKFGILALVTKRILFHEKNIIQWVTDGSWGVVRTHTQFWTKGRLYMVHVTKGFIRKWSAIFMSYFCRWSSPAL